MSSIVILFDVFLMIKLGLWVIERKTDHRGKMSFSSHHLKGTRYAQDIAVHVDLDHLANAVLARFLH